MQKSLAVVCPFHILEKSDTFFVPPLTIDNVLILLLFLSLQLQYTGVRLCQGRVRETRYECNEETDTLEVTSDMILEGEKNFHHDCCLQLSLSLFFSHNG